MKQLFKTFRTATAALGMVLAIAAGSATAASLDQFTPVIGGATVSGTGTATLSSTGIGFIGSGVASGGGIAGPVVLPSNFLNLTASGSSISTGSFLSTTLGPFLSGSFEDARAESGILSFLFAVNGGSAASSFGSHVIYTLSNTSFTNDTFANLSLIQPPGTVPVAPVSFSITQATAIPLPAGIILLLTGLGALGLARRRASA